MPKQSSISATKLAEATAFYMEGGTLKEVTSRFGYSVSTWHKIFRKGADKLARTKHVSERDLAMFAAHAGGKSFGEIAAENGITRQRAHQIVTRTKGRLDRRTLKAMVDGEKTTTRPDASETTGGTHE
jgi:transposase